MIEHYSPELLTLAEIAVAFAGFSAIVSVLGRRPGRDDPRSDSYRLRILVEVALIVVAFSLLPVILSKFETSPALLWRGSAAAFMATGILGSIVNIRRQRQFALLASRSDRVTAGIAWPLDLLQYALLTLVVLGIFSEVSGAIYLAALYVNLVVGGVMFLRVSGSILADPDQ